MNEAIEALSATRRDILSYLKQRGGASISGLSHYLGISDEATRQHLIHLERNGWVMRHDGRENGRSGRPASLYVVSARGEVFFPRKYEELTLAVLEAVTEVHGESALDAALQRIADAKVRRWAPKLKGRTLSQKLELLKSYYREDDEFASVEHGDAPSLVERNCPFLDVANEKPAVCALTLNVLGRLLGCEVRRSRTFQAGDRCCEFEVLVDRPVEKDHAPLRLETAMADEAKG